MTAVAIDSHIVEAFGDHHERVSSMTFVDPLVADDAIARVVNAAGRLLTFERWLDGIEERKRAGPLTAKQEALAAEAFVRAEDDARALACGVIDAVRTLSQAGVAEEALPYYCEVLHRVGGTIDLQLLLAGGRDTFIEQLSARGMEPSLIELMFRALDEGADGLAGLTVTSSEDGVLLVQQGRQRMSMQARNPAPLPLLDGTTWVYGGFLSGLVPDPAAVVKGVPRSSPWGGALTMSRRLTASYRQRARAAAADGVSVHATGFLWVILIWIAIIVIIAVSAGLVIACNQGKIKNLGVCILAAVTLWPFLVIGCFFFDEGAGLNEEGQFTCVSGPSSGGDG